MTPHKVYDQSFFPDAAPRSDWYRSDVWTKDGADTPVTFYTDWSMHLARPRGDGVRRVAVLLEPPAIIDTFYRLADERRDVFDRVATHQRALVATDPVRYVYYPYGTTWIHDPAERRLHAKTRACSLIASAKTSHEGHRLRHDVAAVLGSTSDARDDRLALYGRGYRPVARKTEALAPFRFSVVIENCRAAGFFTEKLVDALLTGAAPIYWGDPAIDAHFDPAGLLVAASRDDVLAHARRVLDPVAGPALYAAMRPAVAENFRRAHAYLAPDAWLCARLGEVLP